MPQARAWTGAADRVICEMRGGGKTWASIGLRLGLSRNTVIERGRRLRAQAPARPPAVVKEYDMLEDPNRAALPAGHVLTWGLISSDPYPKGDEK